MGRMTYAVYECDGAAGSPAHYSSPQGCTKTFNPQHNAGAQFTDPEGMERWVILESATSGSWTRAVGVRGECVTTRPPALVVTSRKLHAHSEYIKTD